MVRIRPSLNLLCSRFVMLPFSKLLREAPCCLKKWWMRLVSVQQPTSSGDINLYKFKILADSWGQRLLGDKHKIYTVQSLGRSTPKEVWGNMVIWYSTHVSRYSFVSLLALLDKLPTRQQIASWVNLPSLTYVFCNEEQETTKHLFFSCRNTEPYGRPCWINFVYLQGQSHGMLS